MGQEIQRMTRHVILVLALLLSPTAMGLTSTLGDDDDGEYFCDAKNNSSGLGGKKVSCDDWQCYEGGRIRIFVEAVDSDKHPADVSGDASCGGTSLHCDGADPTRWTCQDSDDNPEASPGGPCVGRSFETIDQGLYVECEAYPSIGDQCEEETESCAPEGWCPATIGWLGRVCLDPLPPLPPLGNPLEDADWNRIRKWLPPLDDPAPIPPPNEPLPLPPADDFDPCQWNIVDSNCEGINGDILQQLLQRLERDPPSGPGVFMMGSTQGVAGVVCSLSGCFLFAPETSVAGGKFTISRGQ